MNKRRVINVVPYTPVWKEEFEKARAFYKALLEDLNVEIEHVGSTSIEGLWAKPILDIDIIVQDAVDSEKAIKSLESVGYQHVGDLGIKGREVLKYEDDNPNIIWMEHHLYVCLKDCENLKNHLLLRSHLRKNPEAVKAYSDIKRTMAKAHPNDIDAYIDGKTDLILSMLEKEGMAQDEIEKIEAINRK